MTAKSIEPRLRRLASREGYALRKSRAWNWSHDNQQGYMLVDVETNTAVLGGRYQAELTDIAAFFADAD